MPLLAAFIVRIADRCVISSHIADRAVEDIRGEILARCGSPDFRTSMAVQLPSEPRRVGLHVLTDSTTGIAVISDEAMARRTGQEAVDEVAKLFNKMYPEGIALLTPLQGKSFAKPLEALVVKFSSAGSQLDDKARQVRQTVEEVKSLALENVEKVLERGAKIDDIVTQTDQLSQNAEGFHRSSRDLRNQIWWNNVKTKLMIGGVVAAFLLIIWVVFCGGLSCSDSKK